MADEPDALSYIKGFDRFILPDDTPNVEGMYTPFLLTPLPPLPTTTSSYNTLCVCMSVRVR